MNIFLCGPLRALRVLRGKFELTITTGQFNREGRGGREEGRRGYSTMRLQPRMSLASMRPVTSKLPSLYNLPASSVAIKAQE